MELKEKLDEDVVTHHMEKEYQKGKKGKKGKKRFKLNYPFIIFLVIVVIILYITYRVCFSFIPPFFNDPVIGYQKQTLPHYLDSRIYKTVFKISNRTGVDSIFNVYSFLRSTIPAYFKSDPSNITVFNREYLSKDNISFPIRIYQPNNVVKGNTPSLIWIHGSNFLHGTHIQEPDATVCRTIAGQGIIVFSVSYRSQPGFPQSLNDVIEGVKWVYHNTHEFGGERTLISLGGHDAGGNLATAATWLIRDQNDEFPEDLEVKFLGLVNPMMMIPFHDLFKPAFESYRYYKHSGFFIDYDIYEYINEKYVFGNIDKKDFSDLEIEMIMNQTMQNYLAYPGVGAHYYFVPSFFIMYSQHTIFRDEVVSFTKILKKFQASYEEMMMDHHTLLSWNPQYVGYQLARRITQHFEKNIYVKY